VTHRWKVLHFKVDAPDMADPIVTPSLVRRFGPTRGVGTVTKEDIGKFISDAFNGDLAATRNWLAQGAPVHINLGDGLSLMKLLASSGKTEVLRVLLESGADANERIADQNTPLHAAALQGQLAVVELLVAYGADINAAGVNGDTPLRMAITMKNTEVARRLCELGADPDKPGAQGVTDRMFAAIQNVPLPRRQAMPVGPGGPLQPPAGTWTMHELNQFLGGQSPEEIEGLWRVLTPILAERVTRGELTPERASVIQHFMLEVDRARALPDLEDQKIEMMRLLERLNATFPPER
jgi:hypothetical protein